MVGWGQLNDVLKPAWINTFLFFKLVLFPRLFPRFGLDTRSTDARTRWRRPARIGVRCQARPSSALAALNVSKTRLSGLFGGGVGLLGRRATQAGVQNRSCFFRPSFGLFNETFTI